MVCELYFNNTLPQEQKKTKKKQRPESPEKPLTQIERSDTVELGLEGCFSEVDVLYQEREQKKLSLWALITLSLCFFPGLMDSACPGQLF